MASVTPEQEHLLDIREQIARIDKMQAELAQIKINTRLEPWRIFLAAVAAAIAFFGAAAAFLKFTG